ncbi:hypothetical protein [Shewanella atlantica]|uniref:DUF3592 domain-containing protein n=1 Tax=Shewanella atlantica TaxID=271099 RepID=A0A3S0IBH5_9GAMM|nr:hypothetical protein [Shewanella atlantica]RTR29766.1 hypothetical protein EKG39_17010 [Shewanella atlantica]
MKNDSNKQRLVETRLSYLFWAITALLALVVGAIGINNLLYIEQSIKINATVYNKVESQSRSNTGSGTSTSTSLKVIYQFENPYKKDKIELASELAPLVYGRVKKGGDLEIYYNELAKPKTRISQPFHFWLLFIISGLFLSFAFFIATLLTRHSQIAKGRRRQFVYGVAVMLILPVVTNLLLFTQQTRQLAEERSREESWPSWFAFEVAVPKPEWWDSVSIKYLDPMDYTSEEYSYYVEHNTDSDKFHRSFKLTYALMLRHQDDPLELGWLLAKGTTRQYMPMYEFFLSHFMFQEWEGEYCSQPCNDATQMVEMAGDLISMKLDENQVDSSMNLANEIMEYKFSRAGNRGQYYFLYSYRRLLEHTQGQEVAKLKLDSLVEAGLQDAIAQGLASQERKWRRFWKGSQREVGLYSK